MNARSYIRETAGGIEEISINSELLSERKLFLDEKITQETAVSFVKAMMYLSKKKEPISIYINSLGGEINSGLLIYDAIRQCRCTVNLYCIGIAASFAAIILASGKKGHRFILPHSTVVIHEVLLTEGVMGSATSISKISETALEMRDMINGILAKHTGKSLAEINRATSFDNYMNAEQAIKFGICDSIVTDIYTSAVRG